VEILRFGPGSRQPARAVGAVGLAEGTIWPDPRARVTELAFAPRGVLPPQASASDGLFIVVSGGGWLQVGEERAAIHHGEAVHVPAGVVHGAWTDGTPMRVVLVEVMPHGDELAAGPHIEAGSDAPVGGTLAAARGGLVRDGPRPEDHDPAEGEPW
jgi:quercetin dioxygenase-like cupin family protein